jgi:hypothetical protein
MEEDTRPNLARPVAALLLESAAAAGDGIADGGVDGGDGKAAAEGGGGGGAGAGTYVLTVNDKKLHAPLRVRLRLE